VTTHLVEPKDLAAVASVRYALALVEQAPVKDLVLGKRLDRSGRAVEARFQHTPEPLLAAWRIARLLDRATDPGDVVVMSDHLGLGGIFALDQAAADPGQKRRLWTVAGDSAFLELRLVAKTHHGLPMPLDSQVDWDIAQYQWSERVLATSPRAVAELARIGVEADLVGEAEPGGEVSTPDPGLIWAPGPVSRRNQTGEVLRAATSVPAATIMVTIQDREDGIWSGTSWEALRHSREVLGDRVSRESEPPERPTVVVLGDPFAVPEPSVTRLRDEGVPVIVPEGGVASVMWPDAPTWLEADDLARTITGRRLHRERVPINAMVETGGGTEGSSARDLQVSVTIPIFRDVRFLDECVQSILAQDLAPIEILLVDDGSQSDEVDRALAELSEQDRRIRTLGSEHRGVCATRNLAMQEMEGDCLLMVDSDDVLLPTFLSRCAEVLRSHDDIWAVATWTEFFGAYEAIEAKPPFDARVGMRENPIISTSALVDMRVRDAGIRFAPDLAFLYCEDWHFWSQIVAAGGRFGLVPEPLARHRVHSSSGGYLRTELAHAVGRSRAIEPLLR